jgi:hypothetical protein
MSGTRLLDDKALLLEERRDLTRIGGETGTCNEAPSGIVTFTTGLTTLEKGVPDLEA